MARIWTVLTVALLLFSVIALVPPESAEAQSCGNADPCRNARGISCGACHFAVFYEDSWCLYQFLYCVHCRTGEWLLEETTEVGCYPYVY